MRVLNIVMSRSIALSLSIYDLRKCVTQSPILAIRANLLQGSNPKNPDLYASQTPISNAQNMPQPQRAQ